MGWLCRYSIKHPKTVMVIVGVITLAMAPGIPRLTLRTDGHALVPTDDPQVLLDRSIRDEFGVEDPIVVLIKSENPAGVFNAHTIALVQDLTAEFQQIDRVREVDLFSLATEHGHRVKPGTLHFRRFLEPLPTSREDLERLRGDLRAIQLYTGTLVSYDETATSILVGVPKGVDRTEMFRTVRDLVAAKGPLPEEIHVIGAPVAEALLGTHILDDLGVPEAVLDYRTYSDDAIGPEGLPGSLYGLRRWIGRNVGLVPIAIAIMALVFLTSFRSVAAVGLPLSEVGACLVFVFGLMGWLNVPVYLTIAVLPVILTAMGIADEIHIFTRYAEHARQQREVDHLETVTTTMTEMWRPVVKTSVTTAIGFLSFALSPIGPVRVFGIFTAVGIMFCMLWSLTVIPAMLAVCHPRRLVRPPRAVAAGGGAQISPLGRMGAAVVRHRYAIVVAAVIITAAAPFGVRRIRVQDSWIDGFAPDSDFYQTTRYFNEQFLGSHILLVRVDAGHHVLSGEMDASVVEFQTLKLPGELVDDPDTLIGQQIRVKRTTPAPVLHRSGRAPTGPRVWSARIESARREGDQILITGSRKRGLAKAALRLTGDERLEFEITPRPLMTPEVLQRIGALDALITGREQDAVGGVLGTSDYLATANFMSRALRESERRVPDNPDRIEWVWSQYQRIRGLERRQQIVDSDYARSLVTIFLKEANFVDTQHLMDAIREYELTTLAPEGIKLEFAGDVAVSQTLIKAIVTTQTRSLLLSLVGIVGVTALMGRSVVWGLLCVLPCALAVLINFAVMGITGMPLGVATSMFAGMTLGIGVDYAIHLLERYRLARSRGLATDAALTDAVQATGPAIVIDALAVALGFGIMTLSQVPANARLGGLVVLSIVGCLIVTLILLPALTRICAPHLERRGREHSAGEPGEIGGQPTPP